MLKEMLKDIWKVLTFQPGWRPLDSADVVMGIMLWVLMACLVVLVGSLVLWLGYTIYRVIAYDYEDETLPARVTKKKYKPAHTSMTYNAALKMPTTTTHPAEYKVYIVTRNGLEDVIDDEDLYNDVGRGSRIRVTMRIGRSRKEDHEIKYWRVLSYSWR